MSESPSGTGTQGSGSALHAVRICTLAPDLQPGGEKGTPLGEDVMADVVRVEVARVASGACTYTVTLNNWYTATGNDRRPAPGRGAPVTTTELGPADAPFWPRFKYNDFRFLQLGQRLRIDMRYWPDPVGGFDPKAKSPAGWVPMVAGPVTDMRFTFAAREGAQLVLSGQDDLSALTDKNRKRTTLPKSSEQHIVERVLQKAGFPLRSLARPLVQPPPFFGDDAHGLTEAIADGQSYLDFLQKLAERLDFEVFLEFADVTDPESRQELHFEPCRARARPAGTERDLFTLRRDQTLLEYTPTLKVVDQYSKVVIRGRHRDPKIPKEVRGEATTAIVADELHTDPAVDKDPLVSGAEARQRYFGNRQPNEFTLQNATNSDPVRADWLARAVIRRKAREFFTFDAVTVGLPRLRPGNHVEVRGLRPPFDGFFYVTKTTHTFGAEGLRTRLTGQRPGMPLPPYKEGTTPP